MEIPFRKNSAEQTRNSFRYSAEKRAPTAEFRVSRQIPFRHSERNGIPRKNEVLWSSLHNWTK
jgi:hypothetical protein